MTEHTVGTREEWLAARKQLLEHEKELTRRSDELARERQQLPWVQVEKVYAFDTDGGPKTLAAPAAATWRIMSTAPSCTSPTAT
jgi:predicted dithiol-disulfide oxidoreductase (DUF899 family)